MLGYYVYTLDKDGHVTGRTAIMCEGDVEAKVQAKALVEATSLSFGKRHEG